MFRIMATEPPVVNLLPGNFTLDIPASIVILAESENSTAESIVSMDFVSLGVRRAACGYQSCSCSRPLASSGLLNAHKGGK